MYSRGLRRARYLARSESAMSTRLVEGNWLMNDAEPVGDVSLRHPLVRPLW